MKRVKAIGRQGFRRAYPDGRKTTIACLVEEHLNVKDFTDGELEAMKRKLYAIRKYLGWLTEKLAETVLPLAEIGEELGFTLEEVKGDE